MYAKERRDKLRGFVLPEPGVARKLSWHLNLSDDCKSGGKFYFPLNDEVKIMQNFEVNSGK